MHLLCQSVRQMNLIIFTRCIFCNNLSDQEIQSSPPGTSSSQLHQIKKFNHLYQVHHPLHRLHQIKQFNHLRVVHLLHRPVRSRNLIISNPVQLSSQICQTKQKWVCCSVWDQNHHSHNVAIWGRFSVLFFFSSGLKETPHIILLKIFAKTEFTSRGKPPCWCWWSKIFSPWKLWITTEIWWLHLWSGKQWGQGEEAEKSSCGRAGSDDDYMSEVWGEAKGKRLRSSGCGRVGSDDGDRCKRKGIASFPLSSSSRCWERDFSPVQQLPAEGGVVGVFGA